MSQESTQTGTDRAKGSTDRRSFLAGLAAVSGTAAASQGARAAGWGRWGRGTRTNVIMMIPDGSSRAHDTAARYLRAYRDDPDAYPENIPDVELAVDRADANGYMSHFPADPNSMVTDSAAAGTAIATGVKTYNGAISVDTDREPLPTILERAGEAGYATGLVSTTQLTHATPASFAAHVEDRGMQEEIARQFVDETDVDVFLGGDRSHFRADDRDDGEDLIGRAEEQNYAYVETASELESVSEGKVLGLFSESGHLDYYLDRANDADNTQPGLRQMTERAIDLLETRSDEGFFLLVEGGRIDHASHGNDPATVPEQLEFDRALDVAMEYARDGPRRSETLTVSASDHDTGDLGLDYGANVAAIDDLEASQGTLTSAIDAASSTSEIASVLESQAGIDDLTDDELAALEEDPSALTGADGILNDRAGLVWGSGGHTGEDVPIYAAGEHAEQFTGSIDNTDLFEVFAGVLDLDGSGRPGRSTGRGRARGRDRGR
ncbi:alkaline phosphatase [Haloterrigena sp. SYSU A121-1]|uniref:Alkaline phosphatase n=1 Tax=Haloterrigena gelatinilytica TaxID=2741724 RepID=A0A8J8KIA8_9EURY|nr:alkaline phosphatase [Haloterrigena gelatinilytica]NUB93927.1 alkaline phosphatase [Haloterrigena gelatinilytica]